MSLRVPLDFQTHYISLSFFKKWTGYSPEKYRQVEVNVQNRQQ